MRLHLFQRQGDVGEIRLKHQLLCICLTFDILKIILCGGVRNWCIDLGCRCDGIADRDLTVGPVTGHTIPLVTHQTR